LVSDFPAKVHRYGLTETRKSGAIHMFSWGEFEAESPALSLGREFWT